MARYMFDSNCFWQIGFDYVDFLNKDAHEYFCTHIQAREIKGANTQEERKQRLLSVFTILSKETLPTKTALSGKNFVVGQVCVGTTGWFDIIKKDLDFLQKEENNMEDALLAEVAITKDIIFVTSEKKLFDVLTKHKPKCVMSFDLFKQEHNLDKHSKEKSH